MVFMMGDGQWPLFTSEELHLLVFWMCFPSSVQSLDTGRAVAKSFLSRTSREGAKKSWETALFYFYTKIWLVVDNLHQHSNDEDGWP
jgi:hypothetical protein